MERLKQYAAALVSGLVVAALFAVPWLIVARVSEQPGPPSYTPTECAAGDLQCAEWMRVQEGER